MKPDLPAAVATPAEAIWVEGELVRSLMRTQHSTQFVGLILIAMFVGVLWDDARLQLLLGWAALALGAAALRFWIIRRYQVEVVLRGAAEHLAFFQRWRFSFPLSAFIWGATTLLYFDR